ncbi:polyprenyl synthetase family protein [Porphyromonas macacae]|uniref:Farnesyl diphosphate synthase n=1 Tax=Porphyromonas macacae TaxID=28115 RepID=A0A379DH66_9PORP|nr:polyprenyl synthetase family protein [Porphyromonas macacae]SUB77681.1 Farnesyl diphosphate synthase [Porphyromonas macacae]
MYTTRELTELVNNTLDTLHLNRLKPDNLYEPISYTIGLGGKRIRPVLCCAACQAFNNGDPLPALDAAIALEIYHNFTLLHDDLMDNSPTRRGKAAVHKKWNPNQAILSGDAMSIMSFKILSEKYPAEILKKIIIPFAKLSLEICDGQQYDMEFEDRDDVSAEEYIDMIRLKTAVLLGGALEIGATIGGANAVDTKKIYQAGIDMGLAFQLQDDLLDVYANESILGKPTGGDIVNNKKTLLLIKAFEKTKGKSREKLNDYLYWGTDKKAEKIKAVTELYNQLGIKEEVSQMVSDYTENSLNNLKSLSCGEDAIMPIIELANKLKSRAF